MEPFVLEEKHYSVPGGPWSQQTHNAECDAHKKYARLATKGILEIGVLDGYTSRILLEASLGVRVYGIDPLIPDSMNPGMVGNLANIQAIMNHYPKYTFIKDYSFNVSPSWEKPLDYIFIDGSHEYDEVKRDFMEWCPLLSPGGYISLHDSAYGRGGTEHWPGPSQLAMEILTAGELIYLETVGDLTVFKKPEK